MGILPAEGLQGGLDAFLGGAGWRGGDLLLIWLGAVNVDGVGGGIVDHSKIHSLSDVPESC